MRVIHFISSRGMGRGEVYIDLVNELCQSIEVILLVPKDALYRDRVDNRVNIIEYTACNSRNNPLLLMELWWKIKAAKVDIVHTHFVKASQIFKTLNRFLNLPHIATKHNPRKGKVFNSLPHVIAVSKGVRESIANENVQVIYNGVKPVEVLHQMKNDEFTLLAVGRLDKVKGFDIFIEECAKLEFPFILQIVGEGEERERLENLISDLNLTDKVTLLGFRQDIPQLMKNAELVVMSSHSEGFSLVMVESLFYANVFVSTKVSGATEVLDERFLFDGFNIAEKLNDIYQNIERYQEDFSQLQTKLKDKFLLDTIAQEHIVKYREICNLKNSGSD